MLASWLEKKIEKLDLPVVLMEVRRRPKGHMRFVSPLICAAISIIASAFIIKLAIIGKYQDSAEVARGAFGFAAYIQLIIAFWGAPTVSARMIPYERERRTFEHLALTPLTSAEIADQKMAASVLELAGFCLASTPLALTALLIGGASPVGLVAFYALLLLLMAALGYAGITVSCSFAKSESATSIAFLLLFFNVVLGACVRAYTGNVVVEAASRATMPGGGELFVIVATGVGLITLIAGSLLGRLFYSAGDVSLRARIRMAKLAVWALLTVALLSNQQVTWAFVIRYCSVVQDLLACLSPFRALEGMLIMSGYLPASQTGFHDDPGLIGIIGTLALWAGIGWLFRSKAIDRIEALRSGGGGLSLLEMNIV